MLFYYNIAIFVTKFNFINKLFTNLGEKLFIGIEFIISILQQNQTITFSKILLHVL